MVFIVFISFLREHSVSKPHSAASDLVLQCLPKSHKRDVRLFGLNVSMEDKNYCHFLH